MTLRRRGDVDDIGLDLAQHFRRIGKTSGDAEAFTKLAGHEHFAVAQRHDLAAPDAPEREEMLVGNFAAADDGDAQHHWYCARNIFIAPASGTFCFQPRRSRSFWSPDARRPRR